MLEGLYKKDQGREEMIRNTAKEERRQYPRLQRILPLKLAANGYDFATSTLNISCVGAYCCINKYVPPFTRVMVKLTLPLAAGNADKNCAVECKGVVVRTEDADRGGFNIAVFFDRINHIQYQKIHQYINQFLPKDSSFPRFPPEQDGKNKKTG